MSSVNNTLSNGNSKEKSLPTPDKIENCDKLEKQGPIQSTGFTKLTNGTPTIRHPLEVREDSIISNESLELEATPSLESPKELVDNHSISSNVEVGIVLSDQEEEKSLFQAILSPDCQDVRLTKDFPQKRRIPVPSESLTGTPDEISITSDDDIDEIFSRSMESLDEIEDSILEQLGDESPDDPTLDVGAEEGSSESKCWQTCNVGGIEQRIDMKVIEPYKRVLTHGGYNHVDSQIAIIVFRACFLPHHGRVDYNYVMENLFYYVLSTLDQLVTDDYVLVYLHGGAAKDCVPKYSWLKQCYQMIGHRLRKNLKHLYLVHPTFWLKTIVTMSRLFVSSKFTRKIIFVNSLSELFDILPLESAAVPERVHHYDRIKQSIQSKRK